MRRSDRAQSLEFSLALIDHCSHGVVSFSTGEDFPYCLPLSLVRVNNSLYFHCAKAGKKLDLLRQDNRVCVTFVGNDQPDYLPAKNEYTTFFQSVIVTGRAYEVTDDSEKVLALRRLCQTMTPQGMTGDQFERAVTSSLLHTAIWRIDMDEISGKAKLKP